MFNPVSSRVSFPQMEEKVLAFWKEKDIFKRSVDARKGGPRFVLLRRAAHRSTAARRSIMC